MLLSLIETLCIKVGFYGDIKSYFMFIEIYFFQSFHFILKSLSLLLLTADILSAFKYVNNSYSKAENTGLFFIIFDL